MSARPNSWLLLSMLSCAFGLLPVGCASFAKWNGQQIAATNSVVHVSTTPKFARGKFENGRTFTTPATLVLRSDEEASFTLSMDGFEPVEVQLEPGLNPWIWGNILPIPLPLVGFLIDANHGGATTLYPGTVDIDLEPKSGD